MKERIISAESSDAEQAVESGLRPTRLEYFIGQEKVKERLSIYVTAATQREEALDHVLLYGPPGLGKTTLAHIIARELEVNIRPTSGPALERPGDLAAILTNLQPGDVLFIDEIHRLPRTVEEVLYPAMEDFSLDIVIGKGPSARSVRLDLSPFTLVGATTRAGMLTSPLRDRFGVICRLDFYGDEELAEIAQRSAHILEIAMDDEAALEVARRSRGTPRVANRLLRRLRDFAQVRAEGQITVEVARRGLAMLEIDQAGLDPIDRRLLATIIRKYQGGPVGLETLSAAIGEEAVTIEDVYEPFLLQQGLIRRTSRGRMVTQYAVEHLDLELPESASAQAEDLASNQKSFFEDA